MGNMVMWLQSLVHQEGGGGLDLFWILLPLICCMLAMGQRGEERTSQREPVTESWYTHQDIESTYNAIEEETAEWRRQVEAAQETQESLTSRIKSIIGGGREPAERFTVKEANPPRLLQLDDRSGPIYFEMTEVEGGGTVVKATYSNAVKSRIAKFKSSLPLKIPAAPVGNRCPSCGKSVLPEFKLCPYCGEKLITE